eukprot:1071-Heterococcus_DN1.PRE.1
MHAQHTGSNTAPVQLNGVQMPPTNRMFELPPEACSVTFDERGFVTRLTAGCLARVVRGQRAQQVCKRNTSLRPTTAVCTRAWRWLSVNVSAQCFWLNCGVYTIARVLVSKPSVACALRACDHPLAMCTDNYCTALLLYHTTPYYVTSTLQVGTTGGLVGTAGLLEGVGRPLPVTSTRPAPDATRRALTPLTDRLSPKKPKPTASTTATAASKSSSTTASTASNSKSGASPLGKAAAGAAATAGKCCDCMQSAVKGADALFAKAVGSATAAVKSAAPVKPSTSPAAAKPSATASKSTGATATISASKPSPAAAKAQAPGANKLSRPVSSK